MGITESTTASASALPSTAVKNALSGGATAALVPFDPGTMFIGLVAAMIALLNITPPDGAARTPRHVFALVAGSAFLAGVFVPVAVPGLVTYLPWTAGAGERALAYAASAIIGAAPHVAPVIWRAWRELKGGAQ